MSASRISKALAAIAAIALLASPVQAASVSLGKIGAGGTGCPSGTVTGKISPSSLELRFRSFKASAGGARSFDRKACGLAIPVHVPAGLSIAIVGVKYRGRNSLPAGATSTLSTEIFYAGGTGPVIKRTFKGPASGTFTSTVTASSTAWSACGADLNLRINSSIKVETTAGRSASMSVLSQDVASALVYLIKVKRC